MKRTAKCFLILLFLYNTGLSAQEKRPAKERVDAMKIGFLTDRLNLTPEEAKTFWPVYNMYSDDLEKLRKGRRENIINTRENFDDMSDADLEKSVDNEKISSAVQKNIADKKSSETLQIRRRFQT